MLLKVLLQGLRLLLLLLPLLPLLGRMLVLVLLRVRAQAGQRDCARCRYWGWRRGCRASQPRNWGWRRGCRASQPRARVLAAARQRQRGTTDVAPGGTCGTCTSAQGGYRKTAN